ncbi:MAG: spore germination protein [Paenibacillaceae bacterium]|jgi:spore germination protein KB|nr:spore germination protein [Paenibacillaceae bacterium]
MEKSRITQYQLMFVSGFYIFGTMFITLPRSLTVLVLHTGWLCILLATALSVGYAWLLTRLLKRIGDQGFITYVISLMGRWVGMPFALFFLLVPTLFYSSYVMRLVGELFETLIIPETPLGIMLVMFLILRYWNVRGGLRSIGIFAEVLFPLILLILVSMLLLSAGHVEMSRMMPLFDADFSGLYKGTLSVLAVFMEIGIVLYASRGIIKREQTLGSLIKVNITVGFLILLIYWLCLGTFGSAYLMRLAFPTIEMVRNISFVHFFEHVEIIFLAMWVMMNMVKGALTFYACVSGFQSWFGLNSYRRLMFPIAVIIYYLASIPQNLVQAVFRIDQFKGHMYPYAGLLFLLLTEILAWWKAKKGGTAS